MFKNYFISLGEIFKNTFVFAKNTFKNAMPLIWGLIVLQMIIIIPILYFIKEIGFYELKNIYKIITIVGLGLYLFIFFQMFKKVFNFSSFSLGKENISNCRIIKSLLILGLLNCTPFLTLIILYFLSQFIPNSDVFLKIFLNVFTYFFYFMMSFSIVSIVLWQDESIFFAIFKGLKIFFKKIIFAIPIIALMYLFAALISYLGSTLLYSIFIYSNYLNENLVNSIHAIMNVYSLYIICNLYIGFQVAFLKGENE